MLELGAAVERSAESVLRMQASIARLEESSREMDQALEGNEEAIRALLSYLPITQAEIVRLDNRIDSIEAG